MRSVLVSVLSSASTELRNQDEIKALYLGARREVQSARSR